MTCQSEAYREQGSSWPIHSVLRDVCWALSTCLSWWLLDGDKRSGLFTVVFVGSSCSPRPSLLESLNSRPGVGAEQRIRGKCLTHCGPARSDEWALSRRGDMMSRFGPRYDRCCVSARLRPTLASIGRVRGLCGYERRWASRLHLTAATGHRSAREASAHPKPRLSRYTTNRTQTSAYAASGMLR